MGQKVINTFWCESGLSSASRNHLITLCRPFAHYACLRLCSAIAHFIPTVVFILSAMADQRELCQNVGLESRNTTSNYDVTNNAHQLQMTPYATE